MNSSFTHIQRIALYELAPEAHAAMAAFDTAAKKGVDDVIAELVRIRVSQINGCNYCVVMHIQESLEIGEKQERINSLATWREAGIFTTQERAALDLAEAITLISDGKGVANTVWEEAEKHFNSEELAHLVMVITAINSWNRQAVTARYQQK